MSRITLLIPFSLLACANPVVPSGGAKDDQPPMYSEVTIEDKADFTHVHFKFNEQVTVNEPNKRIILSPASLNKIETTNGQNSITIKIINTDSLKPLSYLQLCKGWVQDLNEKNPIDSTPFILLNQNIKITDSSLTHGTITCLNNCAEKNIKLFLFDSIQPNLNFNGYYFTIPGKNGLFQFPSFARNKNTRYLLLDDINANNTIDTNEYYNVIKQANKDSSMLNIQYCPNIRTINPQFELSNKTIRITGLKGASLRHSGFFGYHPDTGFIYLKDSLFPKIIFDEELKKYTPHPSIGTFNIAARASEYSIKDSTITLLFNQALIRNYNKNLTLKFKDSIFHLRPYTFTYPNKLTITSIPSKSFTIIIPDSSFLDVNNNYNKSLSLAIDPSKIATGTLHLTKPSADSNQYIIYLKNKDIYTKYLLLKDKNSTIIRNTAGSYDLFIVRDNDWNLQYTKANIYSLQPEEQVTVLKNIVISDKMENTIQIDTTRLFTNH